MDVIVEHFPSHLHIDLLPAFQGAGNGRRLIQAVLDSLAAAGSRGVHLGVSARNERAMGFYRAVGFTELGSSRHGTAFGWRLPSGPALTQRGTPRRRMRDRRAAAAPSRSTTMVVGSDPPVRGSEAGAAPADGPAAGAA